MEKIKQALDRARKERAGAVGSSIDSDEIDSPVKYAATQSIKSSKEKMRESRI